LIRKDENEAGRFRVILCEGAHPQFEVVVGQIKDQLPMRVLNDAIGSGKAAVGEYLAVVYNGGGQIVGVFAPGELTETLDSTLGLIRQIAGTQGVGEDVSWEVFGPGEAQQSVAKKVSEFSARPDAGKRIYSLLELALAALARTSKCRGFGSCVGGRAARASPQRSRLRHAAPWRGIHWRTDHWATAPGVRTTEAYKSRCETAV